MQQLQNTSAMDEDDHNNNHNKEETHLKESKEVVPLNTWVLISNLKLAYNLTRNPDGTFNRHLAEFLDRKVSENPIPIDGVSSMDVTMDRITGLWARIFIPHHQLQQQDDHLLSSSTTTSPSIPFFFYFHGGSFAHSSANSTLYDTVCRRLANLCKAIVISVNYRRSPEHRFPAPYDDCFAALKWLQIQMKRGNSGISCRFPINTDPSRCFLIGDSNGGNIVHHVGIRAASSDLRPVAVVGHILMMPMFGGMARTASEMRFDGQYFVTMKDRDYYWQCFLPVGADRDHPACNIFGPNSVEQREVLIRVKVPPSLVVLAELDVTRDWQIEYVEGMKRCGKCVQMLLLEEATVGFFIFPNTHHFYKLMDTIYAFIHSS